MKLIICPRCCEIIDLDKVKIKTPADNTVVGCGLVEGDFGACYKCLGEYDPDECRDIRKNLEFTKTTYQELRDSNHKVYMG